MKNLNRYLFLFIAICSFFNSLKAQYVYENWDNIVVEANNILLEYPFIGGLNAPQFNELDLNQDGIMDLVILDRSGQRLRTFLNNGTPNTIDYTYAPSYEASFPTMGSWLITRDYNCDGKMDLFVGGSQITLYENTSNTANGLQFQLIEKIRSAYNVYEFPTNTTLTTVNAGSVNKPAIYDVGGDGDLDLLFFDQGGTKMEYHRNLSVERTGSCGLDYERRSKCWGDFTESTLTGKIYLDSCRFGDLPNPESGNKHAGSTISAFDFDKNGSTDLLIGDVSGFRLTALYNADSSAPYTNSHFFEQDTLFPSYDVPINLPLFPASYFIDVNNDKKKDLLVTTNSNSFGSYTKTVDNILYYKDTASIKTGFQLQADNLFYPNMIDMGQGNNPAFFDANGDGLMDLLMGNEGNLVPGGGRIESKLALYLNIGTANNPAFKLEDNNYLNLPTIPLDVSNNQATQNASPCFGDLDDDGDEDLLIADYLGNLHYFENVPNANNQANFILRTPVFEGINTLGQGAAQLIDLSQDTLLDLVLGNSSGRLEYYENLGSKTKPIFTLSVSSIEWQNGDTVRYHLNGNPSLNKLEIGQQVDVNNTLFTNTGVFQTIAKFGPNNAYIDLINTTVNDGTYNEQNSNAIIDYSDKKFGNVDIIKVGSNRDAKPLFYWQENDLKLIIASRYGQLYFYDSIQNNLPDGNFHLVDSNYLKLNEGVNLSVAGADLSGNGLLDLAIGNEAGGIKILKALRGVGIEDLSSKRVKTNDIVLFPNPSSSIIYIHSNNESLSSATVQIIDNGGKQFGEYQLRNGKISLQTENWPNGIYFVRIISTTKSYTKKLIVQHF